MPEEPYKNREILEMFGEVRSTLNRIEIQTSKTNGRVTKLEGWQNRLIGAWLVLTLIVLPIAYVVIKIITKT